MCAPTVGRWVEVKRKCLLLRKVLMILFRGKLLDALRQAAEAGKLALPPGMRLAQLKGRGQPVPIGVRAIQLISPAITLAVVAG
ncbi:MAG: hypothetical protein HUU20_08285 [Pirellulales bacterium]|nr:hypothetical protein [Pirellulales bacterium]